MKPLKMTHIAMCVRPDELKQAEKFYQELFGMTVAFRETMTTEGWATLPEDGWIYAEENNIDIGLTMLFRDGFAIDLEVRPVATGQNRFSHVGLEVDGEQIRDFRDVAARTGCEITFDSNEILVFNDPYGMRWELTTLPYNDPFGLSAGRREGRWSRAPQSAPVATLTS